MFGGTMYPDSQYSDPLGLGEWYQRFVAAVIKEKYGVEIHYYTKKVDQFLKGESEEGYEIKYDKRIRDFQRLSIEVAEKTRADLPNWTPSGIFRKDNTKYYIQGDDKTAWCFIKEKLVRYFHNNNPKITTKHGTIQTFYINVIDANELAWKVIDLTTHPTPAR